MKPIRLAFWRPFVITALMSLPLLWPLFGELGAEALACTDDGQLYYYQAAVMRHSVGNGLLLSRWMPDAALGYGLPFFNYREPLPRYLVLIPVLLGLPVTSALNLVSAVLIYLTGLGMFYYTRAIFEDELAGYGAAAAAMSAPYVLLDVYRRGNLPESAALALIPWVLWAFFEAARPGRRMWAGVAAACLWAALIFSHNISALLFAPLLGVYLLMLYSAQPLASLKGEPFRATVEGLGLAAVYWIPAFFETNLIQIRAAVSSRNNSYAFNFLSFDEVLALPQPFNPDWLNPSLTINLGLPGLALALIGVGAGWFAFRARGHRLHLIVLSAASVGYAVMSLEAARPIWDALPVLAFVQFPWRLIGRAALLLAPLAGAGLAAPIRLIPRAAAWLSPVSAALGCGTLIAAGLPGTYPAVCPTPPHPTIVDVHRFEREALPGLDNEASYFPAGVAPPEDSPLVADYAAGRPPHRLDERTLPDGASAVVTYRPLGADITLESPQPFSLRYLSYAFPGWRATIDGRLVAVEPEAGSGLITVDVPAGVSTIRIRFGLTPLRALVTLISFLAALSLFIDVYPAIDAQKPPAPPPASPPQRLLWPGLIGLGAVAILLLGGRAALPPEVPTPWRLGREPALAHRLRVSFADQFELLGYQAQAQPWPADGEHQVVTAWRRLADLPEGTNTGVALRLLDENGLNWALNEGLPARGSRPPGLAAHQWPLSTFATDAQMIRLLPGSPPGTYTLTVTLFERASLNPYPAVVTPGSPPVTLIPLQEVEVAPPRSPWQADTLDIQHPVTAPFSQGVTLLGYNLDREELAPGDTFLLTLFWRADDASASASEAPRLAVNGQELELERSRLGTAAGPQAGETWREQHLLRLPPGAQPGPADLALRLGSGTAGLPVGLQVRGVPRVFDVPPVEVPVGRSFDERMQLEGFSLEETAQGTQVLLIWQSLADMPTGYTVFVHALDRDEAIIAQSDAQPAGGARPTTGWLPGEVVLDVHLLRVPLANIEALRIGVYEPLSGQRLGVDASGGNEFLFIPLSGPF